MNASIPGKTYDRRHTGTVIDRCRDGLPERRKLTPDAAVALRCEMEERLGRGCCEEAAESAVGTVFVEFVAGEVDRVPRPEDVRAWQKLAFAEAMRLNRELRRVWVFGEWDDRQVVQRPEMPVPRQHPELHAAIAALDDLSQCVVLDCYFRNLSQRRVAAEYGLTLSQVRTRLGKAVAELRRRMDGTK